MVFFLTKTAKILIFRAESVYKKNSNEKYQGDKITTSIFKKFYEDHYQYKENL